MRILVFTRLIYITVTNNSQSHYSNSTLKALEQQQWRYYSNDDGFAINTEMAEDRVEVWGECVMVMVMVMVMVLLACGWVKNEIEVR